MPGNDDAALMLADRVLGRRAEYGRRVERVHTASLLLAERLAAGGDVERALLGHLGGGESKGDCDGGRAAMAAFLDGQRGRLRALAERNGGRMREVDAFVAGVAKIRDGMLSRQQGQQQTQLHGQAAPSPEEEKEDEEEKEKGGGGEAVDYLAAIKGAMQAHRAAAGDPSEDDMVREMRQRLGEKVSKKKRDQAGAGDNDSKDDDDDDDDDIEEVPDHPGGQDSLAQLKCPITGKPFENPVRNRICGHTYSMEGLDHILRSTGRKSCPVPGCQADAIVRKENCEEDHEMAMVRESNQEGRGREGLFCTEKTLRSRSRSRLQLQLRLRLRLRLHVKHSHTHLSILCLMLALPPLPPPPSQTEGPPLQEADRDREEAEDEPTGWGRRRHRGGWRRGRGRHDLHRLDDIHTTTWYKFGYMTYARTFLHMHTRVSLVCHGIYARHTPQPHCAHTVRSMLHGPLYHLVGKIQIYDTILAYSWPTLPFSRGLLYSSAQHNCMMHLRLTSGPTSSMNSSTRGVTMARPCRFSIPTVTEGCCCPPPASGGRGAPPPPPLPMFSDTASIGACLPLRSRGWWGLPWPSLPSEGSVRERAQQCLTGLCVSSLSLAASKSTHRAVAGHSSSLGLYSAL